MIVARDRRAATVKQAPRTVLAECSSCRPLDGKCVWCEGSGRDPDDPARGRCPACDGSRVCTSCDGRGTMEVAT